MADRKYLYIKNYSSNGEMAISRQVFEKITYDAIIRSEGVKPYKKSGKLFVDYSPVECEITKGNKVDIKVDVIVLKGANLQKVCEDLKEEISQSLMLTCETVPFNITINVAGVETK